MKKSEETLAEHFGRVVRSSDINFWIARLAFLAGCLVVLMLGLGLIVPLSAPMYFLAGYLGILAILPGVITSSWCLFHCWTLRGYPAAGPFRLRLFYHALAGFVPLIAYCLFTTRYFLYLEHIY